MPLPSPPPALGISGGSGNPTQGANDGGVAARKTTPMTAQAKSKAQRRAAPTHFLAIRLPSPDLARAGEAVQQACVADSGSADTHLAVVNVKKLHLTLFVLTVQDADGLALMRDTLAACAADITAVWGTPARPTVPLLGLGTFGKGGVLYVGVDPESPGGVSLVRFAHAVHARFMSAGLLAAERQLCFKAHATLLKRSQASRRCRSKADRARVRKMRLRIPAGFGCRSYGVHRIASVELNEMRTAADGYYVVVDELPVYQGDPAVADIRAEHAEQELALRLKAAELRSQEQASRLQALQKYFQF